MNMTKISRQMSYILRHKPEEFNITLNSSGWCTIAELAKAINVTEATILDIVAADDKQRYSLDRNILIRAAQGHSAPGVAIVHTAVVPPAILYHGTSVDKIKTILSTSIRPMSRHHVHLSADIATAGQVGSRHGNNVVMIIDAERMQAEGHAFYQADNGVWLCAEVPPEFITSLCYPQRTNDAPSD